MQENRIMEIMSFMNKEFSFKEISKMTKEQRENYNRMLDDFKRVNAGNYTTNEKGKVLEDLVNYLLGIYSELFESFGGVHTSTNEIDQFVVARKGANFLIANKFIDERFESFLCECKNYNKKVDVTYVGKFASLMMSTSKKLGILFSYNGITGSNWSAATGFVKKFYLSKEKAKERFCIIDFNINDFEAIQNGSPFFEILHNRIQALELDTDFNYFIKKHENENKMASSLK